MLYTPKSNNITTTIFNATCAILAMGGFVGLIVITMLSIADVEIGIRGSFPAESSHVSSDFEGTLHAIPTTFIDVAAAEFLDAGEYKGAYARRHRRVK